MMNRTPKRRLGISTFLVMILTSSSFLVAVPLTGGATPTPTANQPQANQPQVNQPMGNTPNFNTPNTMQGSTNYITAPQIQFNSTGGFYGVFNSSSGGIEPIRGYLTSSQPLTLRNHYYKIDLPRGKVLDVRLYTENYQYVPFGMGQRISPDFELFTYAGIPDYRTEIDWNINPFLNRPYQENNILTPLSPSGTYYINVSIWYGTGTYTLTITTSDPTDITNAPNANTTGSLDAEWTNPNDASQFRNPDTRWYRFTATHDTNNAVFDEAHGYLNITNWIGTNPWQVDAIIRIFAEDLGYSPDNPLGRPLEKSEAPNRQQEPISMLAPYSGTFYVMVRLANQTSADYLLHLELTPISRFPEGGMFGVSKDRNNDDTDWYWFNMTAATGTGRSDRVIFNLSETSQDPLAPVNLNLWLFAYRPYFRPAGGSVEFDIVNSSFQKDAPYNLTLNPEPRYEEVGAIASYTGIYFLEVEDFNNTGIYDVIKRWDNGPQPVSDLNNQPSQAQGISWGEYWNLSLDMADDHSDFYRVTAQAGQTIDVYFQMPLRSDPSGFGLFTNAPAGLVWVGIYQPGMSLLAWGWNYHFDLLNQTDSLTNDTHASATVAADGDYIVEISALQDGYIGPYQVSPMRTIQVFWHEDWDFATQYRMDISLLPDFNAFPEDPVVKAQLPDLTINEDTPAVATVDLANYFYDADIIQGDQLRYEFSFSGPHNITIQESNGLVSVYPSQDWYGTNTVLVVAKDMANNSATQYWNITALPVNDPPQLVSAGPINISEGDTTWVFDLSLFVRDVDGDNLQFTHAADPNLSVLEFTATSIRLQTAHDFQTTTLGAPYPITFDVSDGQVSVRMTIMLIVVNAIDAPVVTVPSFTLACNEDAGCATVNLRTVFNDPDGDVDSYTVAGNNEVPFLLDNGNGTLKMLPSQDWNGVRDIQLQACKLAGSPLTRYCSGFSAMSFVVAPINDPPRILSQSPIPTNVTMEEAQSKAFSVNAVDPEGVTPKFSWYLNGEPLGTTLATYTFTPTFDTAKGGQSAVVTLRVDIDDGSGGNRAVEWFVTVVDVPRPPQIQIAAPLEGTGRGYYVGDNIRFIASAYDPDGDTLTFTWTDSGGATLLTGDSGSVHFDAKGTRKVILTVTDGILTATTTVNVTIEDKPAASPGFEAPYLVTGMVIAVAAAAVAQRRRRGA